MIRRFWYGDEGYLIHARLLDRRTTFSKNQGDLAIFNFSLTDSVEKLVATMTSADLFSPSRLIIVNGFPTIRDDYQDHFQSLILESTCDHELIFIYKGSPDKRRKFTKFLLDHFESEEFKSFEPWDTPKVRLLVEAMGKGYSWGLGALDQLIDTVGLDLWALSQNIEKLKTAVLPEKVITKMWVDRLANEGEANWFEAADALRKRNKASWLNFCRESSKSDEAFMVLAMVAKQVRFWMILKSVEGKPIESIARHIGKSPYAIKKLMPELRPWTLDQLKRVLTYLFQLDFDAKSGKISPDTGLELLLGEPVWV